MAGPWEKYAQPAANGKPWEKYGGTTPEAVQPVEPYTGTVLPFAIDAQGNRSLAVPTAITGLVDSVKNAVTAPGRAMSGELQVMGPDGNVSPEAIQEGVNFSTLALPSSPAQIAARAPVAAVAPELTAGQQAATAATRIGVDLPRAMATDRGVVQSLGQGMANQPLVGGPIIRGIDRAKEQLGQAATQVQNQLGTGNVAGAGAALRSDIQSFAGKTLDDLVTDKYGVVDDLVDNNVKIPLSATMQKATQIAEARANAALKGSRANAQVSEALDRSVATPAVPATPPKYGLPKYGDPLPIVKPATPGTPAIEGGINYEGIKKLRTSVGEMLKNPQMAPAGTSQDELRALYGSLSDDLRGVVKAAGGDEAATAFEAANTFAARTAAEQKAFDRILGPQSDEGLFSRIQAMAGSNSRADMQNLLRVKRAASPETWKEMSSSVLSTMGRDMEGNFSPDRFITAYGKLSQNGKSLLFKDGGSDDLAKSLDDIYTVSQRFKEISSKYGNPSGTARNAGWVAAGAGLVTAPITTLSTVAGGNLVSRYLAAPTSAKQIASWTRAYERAATNPTPNAEKVLGLRARALAATIANDTGANAGQLTNMLSRVEKVAAGDENGGEAREQQPQQSQWRYPDGTPYNPGVL